jgi:uncharacterized protein
MKIVVDIGHPSHVHITKHFIRIMKEKGHEVLLTATEKDVTLDLLRSYQIPFRNLGRYGGSTAAKALRVPLMDYHMWRAVRRFKPDIFLGIGSIRAPHVAFLLGSASVNFEDTEHSMEQIRLYLPFVDTVCTATCFMRDLGRKQIRYKGYHELAYLHPRYFTPRPDIMADMDLDPDEITFVMRFGAFDATHDTHSSGLRKEYIRPLIETLEDHGRILITSEKPIDPSLEKYRFNLPPDRFHQVLAHATMYIGEGSTSAEEAAVLGVPAFHFERMMDAHGRVYPFSEVAGVLHELQDTYHLLYGFAEEERLLSCVGMLLEKGTERIREEWKARRERLLREKIDVTQFMVWLIDEFPESVARMRSEPELQEKFR